MSMQEATVASGWDPVLTAAHYDSDDGWDKIELRKKYYKLAALDALHKISVLSLRAAGTDKDALVVDVGSSYPGFLKHWRSSGHLGELIAIEPNVGQIGEEGFFQPFEGDSTTYGDNFYRFYGGLLSEELKGIKIFQADLSDLSITFIDPDDSRERTLTETADVVTSNLAMYHVHPSRQANAHLQIKSLLQTETGIYAEITRGGNYKRGIHADDILIGEALRIVMGQTVAIPTPIHHAYTIDSAKNQLPVNYQHVYMYRQSSDIRLTTNEEIDIKLGCHKSIRDLYVTPNGQIPTPEQHCEAIEMAIGGKLRRAREGLEPILDYVEEALFLSSDSSIDRSTFNHNFTVLK